MLYLVYGSNAYGVQRQVAGIIEVLGKESSAVRVDGETAEYEALAERLVGQSLFSLGDQVIIVRGLSKSKAVSERILELRTRVPEDTHVVFVEPEIDKRSSFFKTLKREATVHECKDLNERELASWLIGEASQLGGTIDMPTAQLLAQYVGVQQQRAASELEKLILYEPEVTRDAVEKMVEKTVQENIFELLDAVTRGEMEKSAQSVQKLLRARVEPIYILTMIAWQLHNIALVKSAGTMSASEIASKAKLAPFVVQKTQRITSKLSLAAIKEMIELTSKADLALKTSTVDQTQLIHQLVGKLSRIAG